MSRPTHAAMVRAILAVYAQAEQADLDDGRTWYPRAHALVVQWAETFGRSIANVASVVAALSPQVDWSSNLVIAADVLHGNPPSLNGYIRTNLAKACTIRDEHLPNTLSVFKQGCKVANFAANLAGNWTTAVTVDTHAAQVAAGSPLANLRVDTWLRYEPVHAAYCAAARRVGMPPAFLQAITWHTWKRLYPRDRKRNIRRQW